jgi:putative ABC transport system permease protein
MGTLLHDVRYGARLLLKRPAFTLMTIAALALGVGANTAIFSVVNAVVLRPLPFPDAGKLMLIWGAVKGDSTRQSDVVSYPNFEDLRAQTQSFEHVAAYVASGATLTREGGEPEQLSGAIVSADLFPTLGAAAERGRVFTRDEDKADAPPVVLLSNGTWRSRFNSDPNIVGRELKLNGRDVTVVGVMTTGFKFPVEQLKTDYWMPLASDPTVMSRSQSRGIQFLRVVTRLKPGVTQAQAQAELSTVAARLEQQYQENNEGLGFRVAALHEEVVGDIRGSLLMLLGAVGFVLLIACANVANLLLARATARSKEMAIRTALGASRWRIVRQLLTESLILSLAGGLIGLLLAAWGIDLLLAVLPTDIPRAQEIGRDTRVLSFTLGVSVLAGLIFGLAPALQASSPELNESLKEGTRGSTGGSYRNRVRSLLVVSEIMLSMVLLVGAGLLVKSFVRVTHVSPGFETSHVLTVSLSVPRARYGEPAQQRAFYHEVLARAGELPGVESVGAINLLPLSGNDRTASFDIEGETSTPGNEPEAGTRIVSPDYFRALGVPLLRGRAFNDRDTEDQPRVMIVNDSLARHFMPGQDPLTKRIKLGDDVWQIVGVVGDVRHGGVDVPAQPEFYVPYPQSPERGMSLVVRTSAPDAGALTSELRGVVRSVDKDLFFPEARTMNQLLAGSLARRRFNTVLVGIFAAAAMLLAAIGIYGVISYTVTQRTHEIGIRVALGAQPGDVFRLIVGHGMMLAAAGLALGLAGALVVSRVMSGLLFEVGTGDPQVLGSITLLLAGVAFLACYIPARRATKVDPMVALRYE